MGATMSLPQLIGLPGRSLTVDDSLGVVDAWVDRWRGPTAALLQWAGVVLVALVSMAEIDRLIAGSLGTVDPGQGNSAPLAGAIGPTSPAATDSWEIWLSNAATRGSVGAWIIASVVIDVAFIVAYWRLFHALIRARADDARRKAHRSRLRLLVGADGLENGLLVIGALALLWAGDGPDGRPVAFIPMDAASLFATAVAITALIKWILLGLLLIGLVRDPKVRLVAKRVIRRLAQALWLHRLSSLLVAALFAVSCLPFDGVLDQLPDIQRQWIGTAWFHGPIAAGSIVIASYAAFALGRARTRTFIDVNVRRMTRYEAPKLTTALWWLSPVVICLVLWAYTWMATGAWQVGPTFWVFVLTPVLAVVLSLLPATGVSPEPRPDAIGRAQYAWLGGDVIAVLLWMTAGVGLVRSFTGPVFLGWFESQYFTAGAWWIAVSILVVGVLVAVFSPKLLQLPEATTADELSWTDPRLALIVPDPAAAPPPGDDPDAQDVVATWRGHRARLGWFFGAGVGFLLLLASAPNPFATGLGAVAIAVLTLTAWGAVLGSFTLAQQDYLPLRVFRRMRMRAAPVLTMAITIPLISAIAFAEMGMDDPRLHSVRRDGSTLTSSADGPPTTTERGDSRTPFSAITDALDQRVATIGDDACTLEGTSAIPVVIFVAEGGGIRAAYWTTRVLEELRDSSGCFATSTLLSSGVSGGSVGIAIARSGAIGDDATTALNGVASPDTVATGVTGLLVSDLIASSTGVRVPSWVGGEPGWRDRAALIELSWQDDVGQLQKAADFQSHDLVGLPMLNSTDARTKCRVPVTDVPVAGDDARCTQAVGAPAVTLPILDTCIATLDWAGAAMLSARFPIITPAGRLGDGDEDDGDHEGDDSSPRDACGAQTRQLIDGGYAEGSGLGTAADLAPLIASTIRAKNAEATGDRYLVPILVLAQNSAGYDLAEDLRSVSSEALVPLVGAAAAATQTTKSAWIQRIATAFSQACPGSGEAPGTGPAAACEEALAAVDDALPGQVVVVAPSTKPTVVPPLGWALSSFSIASMERSLEDQLAGNGTGAFADLHDLLELKQEPPKTE